MSVSIWIIDGNVYGSKTLALHDVKQAVLSAKRSTLLCKITALLHWLTAKNNSQGYDAGFPRFLYFHHENRSLRWLQMVVLLCLLHLPEDTIKHVWHNGVHILEQTWNKTKKSAQRVKTHNDMHLDTSHASCKQITHILYNAMPCLWAISFFNSVQCQNSTATTVVLHNSADVYLTFWLLS